MWARMTSTFSLLGLSPRHPGAATRTASFAHQLARAKRNRAFRLNAGGALSCPNGHVAVKRRVADLSSNLTQAVRGSV
jgi:hypothetical protein